MVPTFLVIGAEKAGTSSLQHYLGQHPQIYMSPLKEPRFFALEGETPQFVDPLQNWLKTSGIFTWEQYLALFAGATAAHRAVGEITPMYLQWAEKAAARIYHYLPQVRLVAILRHPVDRAYSAYLQHVRDGYETAASFEAALALEPRRSPLYYSPGWQYHTSGLYYSQLKSYYSRFPREHIRLYLYDDWVQQPATILRDLFAFLGVAADFVPDMTRRHNLGGLPRHRRWHDLLAHHHPAKAWVRDHVPWSIRHRLSALKEALINRNTVAPPRLDPAVRRVRIEDYRSDLEQLQVLTGLDVSRWLSDPAGAPPLTNVDTNRLGRA
jgi:hypothetical protein